jgi:group I intron endonuclease
MCYVGLTVLTVEERYKEHLRNMRKGTVSPMYDDMRKLGVDKFTITPVASCTTISDLRTTEKQVIRQENCRYPNGYNRVEGGVWKPRYKHSNETIQLIREKAVAYANTPTGKLAKRNAFLGKHHTVEARAKISNARLGIEFSDEHRANLSLAQKRRFLDPMQRRVGSGAKLTDDQIRSIYTRIISGETLQDLCIEFSITKNPLKNHLARVIGQDWCSSIQDWSSRPIMVRWRRIKERNEK